MLWIRRVIRSFIYDWDLQKCFLNDVQNLKKVTVENPSSLKLINDYAFANCAALIEFEFPDSLEEVTETAFENCVSIKKLFRF